MKRSIASFHSKVAQCTYQECKTCNESFPSLVVSSTSGECVKCLRDKRSPKLYSHGNGMDPGTVPPELQGLTQVEELLISAVIPMMTLYRLPLGQYGYSGHIVNLPQNVQAIATSLPRLPSDIDVVLVRKPGAHETHKDFQVRRSKVLDALLWLRLNNPYYSRITLDLNTLSLLPEDGNLTELCTVTLPDNTTNEPQPQPSTDDCDDFMPGTFVPMVHQMDTEVTVVRRAINGDNGRSDGGTGVGAGGHVGDGSEDDVSGNGGDGDPGASASYDRQPMPWPQVGNSPINEFQTEGYITQAFPTLFPTGAAEYLAPRIHPITVGNYFKHLLMYKDGRFAKHPRFRYFALNTEMRWRALQAGRIYVRQHPQDSQLTIQELRQMVGNEGASLSSRVLHFGTSLRGTSQYWLKQRSRLTAMVDTLGLPSVYFTHSAADLQWPELAQLICPDDPGSRVSRNTALNENPAIADWFFYNRIHLYMKHFYIDGLKAKDYWLRFEWQHRGSPHVHGLAWLADAPDVLQALSSTASETELHVATAYIDSIISTTNPAVARDGNDISNAPQPQVNPHVCNKPYSAVQDLQQDLIELVATCQRHTRCSPSYCLRHKRSGPLECRFGYPKPLQPATTITGSGNDAEVLTARNDPLINSFNPTQLSSWRANVDMQYCVSRNKVIQYLAKYAAKSEPRSQPLKEIYKNIIGGLTDNDTTLKAVQKLLINSVGERDYSAQETSHLLLQIPMFLCSRNFVVLSVDGTRLVEERLDDDQPATTLSLLDHYVSRPSSTIFEVMTLLYYTQHYSVVNGEPRNRKKEAVVIVRPYYPPDLDGPKYELYCRQKLMLHKPFRQEQELLGTFATFALAYAEYLQSGSIPTCLEDDMHNLQHQQHDSDTDGDNEDSLERNERSRPVDDWMLICQNQPDLDTTSADPADWCSAAAAYPNLDEAPSFVARNRETFTIAPNHSNNADPTKLQGKQLRVYQLVQQHLMHINTEPLRIIISGTAGTGKSFLIHCLKQLLDARLKVAAPTGVAAFNVDGCTLHSLFDLPTRGNLKPLTGSRLQSIQDRFSQIRYLIIDEMSMVGRKILGQIDTRLRQAVPRNADKVFGGCSCLLFGDFGQLPPVMDSPLFTTKSGSAMSDLGRTVYQTFTKAVVLTEVMRQSGNNPEQRLFRNILHHLRNGEVTLEDWHHLMSQTTAQISDLTRFADALHLLRTREEVQEHNISMLCACGHPVAKIKAINGPGANKAHADDAGGLEPVVLLAHSARVMLTSNLWVETGLVNGAMGTVQAICYKSGSPPDLPLAVMVKFDHYAEPTCHDGSVPIVPVRRNWLVTGAACSRLQLPLKLAWAVTIHKSQGLTLDKAVINLEKSDFCAGLSFVACSHVRKLSDLLFRPPFDYQRIAHLGTTSNFRDRQLEDHRLNTLEQSTFQY